MNITHWILVGVIILPIGLACCFICLVVRRALGDQSAVHPDLVEMRQLQQLGANGQPPGLIENGVGIRGRPAEPRPIAGVVMPEVDELDELDDPVANIGAAEVNAAAAVACAGLALGNPAAERALNAAAPIANIGEPREENDGGEQRASIATRLLAALAAMLGLCLAGIFPEREVVEGNANDVELVEIANRPLGENANEQRAQDANRGMEENLNRPQESRAQNAVEPPADNLADPGVESTDEPRAENAGRQIRENISGPRPASKNRSQEENVVEELSSNTDEPQTENTYRPRAENTDGPRAGNSDELRVGDTDGLAAGNADRQIPENINSPGAGNAVERRTESVEAHGNSLAVGAAPAESSHQRANNELRVSPRPRDRDQLPMFILINEEARGRPTPNFRLSRFKSDSEEENTF
ncbi:uncharacterized protein LOC110119063 isoform X2 [Ceratitis capitata]|uniref:uncharacterized protein LOC110119063 isoform X1 n=1 Tax=Ceratitis capitata TaxID=7213 RepID=UPI000A11D1DF|nr:uncharacterized protein LOC110119063 isoform X1 [Ceratitis capitata]XP_020717940.1 uncharacterized protein LOC110119063 isoform X2 [Ceratitis capitata]